MKIEKITNKDAALEKAMHDIFEEADREKNITDTGFKPFAYAVKDDNGKILGGIHGFRIFCEIYVDELCLKKEIRNQGIGKALLEIVEKEMNDGQCDNINLHTSNFQEAVKFYEKCGFKVEFIRKNSKNPAFDKYYMIKKI
jgi:ribosomal protein S18 acetylase RimI-like enzyme